MFVFRTVLLQQQWLLINIQRHIKLLKADIKR